MPDLAEALDDIGELKRRYRAEGAVFVDGSRLAPVLRGLGATRADLDRLRRVGDRLPEDPTLPFRRSRNGRFCYDAEAGRAYRLEFQPFVLSQEEDFVRHDSGMVRKFAEIGPDLQDNTAAQALMTFQFLMIGDVDIRPRPHLDYSTARWILTLFHLRTITTPQMLGQPALEGVHSDGVDHTMTTLIDSRNMTPDSAITYLHDRRERNGTPWYAVDPAHVVGHHQHRGFLDTMLVADHERKHSVTPVRAEDPTDNATRDMLIFFTRRPATENHISFPYDSQRPHAATPMEIDIPAYAMTGAVRR
ncbi:hypothetical protein ACWT_0253 [Actinoplanes sp. SE50]|uniref:2OG-Fe dioxygenase family protein n=1 Tax=unclassified Actinoplanes TaxID=2626549 RepID=UPI00023EBE51|nr:MULTISPECIES: 2OG-Fe dioxygenase family protein [unclassified Actinoplanes]AEV81265.1 hypothetical protein ACPL_368 [Actinoplanes sp. SE50/110]ATO79668.1 hypothetical protein ACWT_0253 [Actinoplanes sp. SE50]SLL97071.1 hypothetical protein ACSP50_0267 [Actinoplanes sp. SE50/110]